MERDNVLYLWSLSSPHLPLHPFLLSILRSFFPSSFLSSLHPPSFLPSMLVFPFHFLPHIINAFHFFFLVSLLCGPSFQLFAFYIFFTSLSLFTCILLPALSPPSFSPFFPKSLLLQFCPLPRSLSQSPFFPITPPLKSYFGNSRPFFTSLLDEEPS